MIKTFALVLLAAAPMLAAGGSMTAAERAYLLEQLEKSKKDMLASIEGVSAAQWKFKAAPERWSVQECAEHIVLAESFIFEGAQRVLQSPAVDRPASSNSEVDHKIVAGVQDRSRKATAP